MTFITIPVLWAPDNLEELEDMGRKIEYIEGDYCFNVAHLVGYHKDDNNCLLIRLSNGDVFRSRLQFEAFKELLRATEVAVDLEINEN